MITPKVGSVGPRSPTLSNHCMSRSSFTNMPSSPVKVRMRGGGKYNGKAHQSCRGTLPPRLGNRSRSSKAVRRRLFTCSGRTAVSRTSAARKLCSTVKSCAFRMTWSSLDTCGCRRCDSGPRTVASCTTALRCSSTNTAMSGGCYTRPERPSTPCEPASLPRGSTAARVYLEGSGLQGLWPT